MTLRRKKPAPIAPPARVTAGGSGRVLRRAEELADIFKVLGNANRLKILVFLEESEKTVGDMEATLAIHQPTLSQQLRELREAGLIMGRKVAKSVIYSLNEDPGRRALQTIYLANGHGAPPAAAPRTVRNSSHQAAVFADVVPTRAAHTPEWHPASRFGFRSK